MGYYFLDGAFHSDTGRPLPKGAQRVPRPPEVGETWDTASRSFVRDMAAAADHGLPPRHIEQAYAVKRVEAALIASGVMLTHGLLAEEATALGMPLADLAARVLDRDAEFRAREIQRRLTKAAVQEEIQ